MNDFKHFFTERENNLLLEQVQEISYAEAKRKDMFGPVYHGTTKENREKIKKDGFNIFVGSERTGEIRHGYELEIYGGTGLPAPIHHLGYGVYFTTVKAIAKEFNQGGATGLIPYYLDVPRLETINFGSPGNMMKWWIQNGYDMDRSMDPLKRMQATINLTNNLKSKYDAVWYKGKGIRRLLDGDQICVYDVNRIYKINPELSAEGEFAPGDRFVIKGTNIVATVKGVRERYLTVKYTDPENQVKSTYYNEILNELESQYPHWREMEENEKQQRMNRFFDGASVAINFPIKWAGRKLKKGERLKNN